MKKTRTRRNRSLRPGAPDPLCAIFKNPWSGVSLLNLRHVWQCKLLMSSPCFHIYPVTYIHTFFPPSACIVFETFIRGPRVSWTLFDVLWRKAFHTFNSTPGVLANRIERGGSDGRATPGWSGLRAHGRNSRIGYDLWLDRLRCSLASARIQRTPCDLSVTTSQLRTLTASTPHPAA